MNFCYFYQLYQKLDDYFNLQHTTVQQNSNSIKVPSMKIVLLMQCIVTTVSHGLLLNLLVQINYIYSFKQKNRSCSLYFVNFCPIEQNYPRYTLVSAKKLLLLPSTIFMKFYTKSQMKRSMYCRIYHRTYFTLKCY